MPKRRHCDESLFKFDCKHDLSAGGLIFITTANINTNNTNKSVVLWDGGSVCDC